MAGLRWVRSVPLRRVGLLARIVLVSHRAGEGGQAANLMSVDADEI